MQQAEAAAVPERRIHPLIKHAPDPEHPGWWTWELPDAERYHATLGKLLVRAEGAGRARCRMFPTKAHSNLGEVMHGGAMLTFIDIAMFAGGYAAGGDFGPSVTLDLSTHFLEAGQIGTPLDCTVELLRESRNMAVLRGTVEQGDVLVASWSGTLRKISRT